MNRNHNYLFSCLVENENDEHSVVKQLRANAEMLKSVLHQTQKEIAYIKHKLLEIESTSSKEHKLKRKGVPKTVSVSS